MKSLFFVVICCVSFSHVGFSQSSEEKQRQKMIEEAEERKQEYINDFVETLNVDEFQEQIIKQTLESYYVEWVKISQYKIPVYEKKAMVEQLDAHHFNDLKTIVSDEVLKKVIAATKMENYKDIQKQIKKRKKKRKQKN